MTGTYKTVTNPEELAAALARCREAQRAFSSYSQEQVDAIFLAAATAANPRYPLMSEIRQMYLDAYYGN